MTGQRNRAHDTVMKETPPFRLEPRIVDPNVLAPQQGSTHKHHPPAQELVAQINQSATPSSLLLGQALAHPDERVVVAAIGKWGYLLSTEDCWRICKRGLQACEAENIVWNPILDALDDRGYWPSRYGLSEEDVERHRYAHEQIEALVDWLKSRVDPGEVEAVLQFRSYHIHATVARHTSIITEELAERLPWPELAQNPNLPASIATRIAERAAAVITTDQELATIQPKYKICGPYYGEMDYARKTLSNLVKHNHTIPANIVDQIVNSLPDRGFWALDVLQDLGTHITAKHIDAAIELGHEGMWSILARHPAATKENKLRILQKSEGKTLFRVRKTLSHDLDALMDPQIRRRVLQTASAGIFVQAMKTVAQAETDLFLNVLDRFMAKSPDKLVSHVTARKGQSQEWVTRIHEHHMDVFVAGIVRSNHLGALKKMLSFEPTANNPKIHEALVNHQKASKQLLFELLKSVRGDLFRRGFQRLAEQKSYAYLNGLLDFLEYEQPAGIADLRPEDLAPLLQCEFNEIRMRAITFLSKIQAKLPDSQSEPTLAPSVQTARKA